MGIIDNLYGDMLGQQLNFISYQDSAAEEAALQRIEKLIEAAFIKPELSDELIDQIGAYGYESGRNCFARGLALGFRLAGELQCIE